MPTNISLVANPTTVNVGGTSSIKVNMTLAPATTVNIALSQGTSAVANTTVTIPGETFPAIKLAGETATSTDYVLTTDRGTLIRTTDPSVFTLQE